MVSIRRHAAFWSAAAALTLGSAAQAETRGFVVSWVYYGNASVDSDCPEGLNPGADGTFRRILKERNTPPAEIERLMEDFPQTMREANVGNRGIIDGKPVNAYINPTATPDPMLKLGKGHTGLGFNLDGKVSPEDFVDIETGEKGVDNQFYRVIGCVSQLRSARGKLPTFPEIQWDMMRDHTPAWIIEVSGIDSLQDDDDVLVTVQRATRPVVRNSQGQPQADMTFTPDPTPRTDVNKVRGKLKNGLVVTEAFDFFMPGEPFAQAEYAFKDARLRLRLNEDGTASAIVGGYQNWRTIYTSWATGGTTFELNAGFDIPGLYYALRKSADAYPDPKTGQNAYISSAYTIEAVPAFIVHPEPQTAQTR
jgi:hypothetical protein